VNPALRCYASHTTVPEARVGDNRGYRREPAFVGISGCYSGLRREEASMANPFVHVELNTIDVDKAKKFYGTLFDWQMEDVEMGPTGRYTMIKTGGTGGGILKHPMPGEPPPIDPSECPTSPGDCWRRGWDSNPRYPFGYNGFRDRPLQPLAYLSF
jgi:bleomycin resistance family protein